MPQAALELDGVDKRYGAVVALDGLSLSAPKGRITAILGPNGAGKTTTVEICAGLRKPDAGRLNVLGRNPVTEAAELRATVGVMPQAAGGGVAGIYPSARPRDVLRLFAALYANPLDVDTLIDRLGLDRVVRTPWRRLSGGEQQRLSLALAIVGRPTLTFLDEPTAGLDLRGRHETWSLLEELRGAGVTVIVTTHAMDEAERLADHIVIIDRGRAVAAGSPADLTAGNRSLEDVFLDLTAPGRTS